MLNADQQALSNASVTDFLILEYQGDIGGRVAHTTFGKRADGTPYVVELGANWVQGLGTPPDGPENPIWTLAKLYNLTNTYSDYSAIETFNETGVVNFTYLLDDFDDAYASLEQAAGVLLSQNLQDRTMRAGLSLAGWKPKKSAAAQAVEWWIFDWEYAFPPARMRSTSRFALKLTMSRTKALKSSLLPTM
ncbi:MAG: hypothetical protein Q9167_006666 [Letrouitia subvulpina]